MSFEAALHAKVIQLDRLCLDMCAAAESGHPTSCMSLGHIVTVLLYHSMRWVPDDPRYPTSDRLVLSEGHAVPIIYAALADLGATVGFGSERRALKLDDLYTLRDKDSVLDGHPNPVIGFPFFDAATGSLGQGLSIAVGLGIAAQIDEYDKKIYCIIGDGESREGQVWEAIDLLVDRKCTNVLPIFNCNAYGQADKVSAQQSADRLAKKLEAAGIENVITIDGHDPDSIRAAFNAFADKDNKKLTAIVAKTVKGWGAPSLQGAGWHGKPPTGAKLEAAREELNATGVGLTSALAGTDELRIYPPAQFTPRELVAEKPMTFTEAMKKYDFGSTLQAGRFATRKAFGIALRALGHNNPNVMALDGDVRNSTFSEWFLNDKELANRFVECKIAEQNMYSVAAGLSAANKIPFCSTFAKFVTRGYDQIEMAINSGANIKVIGTHSGVTPCSDGPSQMSLPDVAWFRSLSTVKDHRGNPACYVLQPSDAYSAYALTLAMAQHEGACYMRAARPDVEFLYDDNTEFKLGGFEVLTQGRDLLIVSAGFMVHECNKALDALDKAGIDASLVDMYSMPFDADALLDLANENGGNILVVEDNYGGGLASAVSEACTESGDAFTIKHMCVRRIPKSTRTEEEQLRMLGLHHTDIAKTAASMVGVGV